MLSFSIVEDLQHNSSGLSSVILYLYFDFDGECNKALDNALRSLLWQATKRTGSSFRKIQQLFELCKHDENQHTTLSLIRSLESILQATGRVIVVFDALGECTTRQGLLQWLVESAAKDSSGIQIIARSRKEYDIEVAFIKWLINNVMLSLEQLEVDRNIKAYVHDRIRSDPKL